MSNKDEAFAKQLQDQERAMAQIEKDKARRSKRKPNVDEDADLSLAIQMQEQEEATLQAAMAMRHNQRHTPLVTVMLLSFNLLGFAYVMYDSNWQFASWESNIMYGPSLQDLVDNGAKSTTLILEGEWSRLFKPIFLHAGVLHLVFNMAMLLRVGMALEEVYGPVKTAAVYLIAGVSGVGCSAVFIPEIDGVGASGAVFGLLGALFGDFAHNFMLLSEGKWAYLASLVLYGLLGLVMGIVPVVDNFTQVGGFIAGFCVGAFLLANKRVDEYDEPLLPWYSTVLSWSALLFLAVWFISGLAFLYGQRDTAEWCTFCRTVNCIETSYWDCPT